MNEQFTTEELWMLVRHYERLIQLLQDQLEKEDGKPNEKQDR
jgi:hypothetical protein